MERIIRRAQVGNLFMVMAPEGWVYKVIDLTDINAIHSRPDLLTDAYMPVELNAFTAQAIGFVPVQANEYAIYDPIGRVKLVIHAINAKDMAVKAHTVDTESIIYMHYVHDLQNLYRALFLEELDITSILQS